MRDEIIAMAQKALPLEASDVHEVIADVSILLAKMVYSTRDTAEQAINATAAVDVLSAASKALRTERILNLAYKKGSIAVSRNEFPRFGV